MQKAFNAKPQRSIMSPMEKEDLIAGAAALSVIIAISASYAWNFILFQGVFSFLAGSFSTYVIQRKLQVSAEKRKYERGYKRAMRERIYGPSFEGFTLTLNRLQDIQDPKEDDHISPLEGINNIMGSYLFLLAEAEIKEKITKLHHSLSEYSTLLHDAEEIVSAISIGVIHDEAAEIRCVNLKATEFSIKSIKVPKRTLGLRDAIFRKNNSLKLFQKDGFNPNTLTIYTDSETQEMTDTAKIQKVYNDIMKKAWADSKVVEHEEKREHLIKDIEELIPKLRSKIEK
jgi:hypothetical protein